MRAFLEFDQRGHDDDFRAFGQGEDVGDDFIGGAGLDGASALGAVHLAEAGEEHAQEVVDFGDGAHGRARVAARGLLFQRNGGGKAFDLVHVRLVHLGEELAGVGRERFDITALSFRIKGVESKRGLPGTGKSGDDDQLVAWQIDLDVFQIVCACTANNDFFLVFRHGACCFVNEK